MHRDPLLVGLLALLLASVMAFLLGIIPYPLGLLVLVILIVARAMHLKGSGKRRG